MCRGVLRPSYAPSKLTIGFADFARPRTRLNFATPTLANQIKNVPLRNPEDSADHGIDTSDPTFLQLMKKTSMKNLNEAS